MKQINLSGVIGLDSGPELLREGLEQAAGGPVELVVSSPGGLVSACLDMYNQLRNYPGVITARLAGFAMSAASYIPLAADRVVAEDNAVYMIHNVQGIVLGDHNDMARAAEVGRAMSVMIAKGYSRFSGKELGEVTAMMDEETFFFGEQIAQAGFAHETVEHSGEEDSAAEDETTATALAKDAFTAMNSRMAADKQKMQADLDRAAVMLAGETIGDRGGKGSSRRNAKPEPEEEKMDLKTLKANHQDLVAAITDEALANQDTLLAEAAAQGKNEGAEGERQRIADVRAQLIPGHEKLIERMELDGKSTGADAAKAIVAQEKSLRAKAADELDEGDDQVPPAEPPPAGSGKTMKLAEFNNLDTRAQQDFVNNGGQVLA